MTFINYNAHLLGTYLLLLIIVTVVTVWYKYMTIIIVQSTIIPYYGFWENKHIHKETLLVPVTEQLMHTLHVHVQLLRY